jgi:hypothetical protein
MRDPSDDHHPSQDQHRGPVMMTFREAAVRVMVETVLGVSEAEASDFVDREYAPELLREEVTAEDVAEFREGWLRGMARTVEADWPELAERPYVVGLLPGRRG